MHNGGCTSIGLIGPCSTNKIGSVCNASHKVAKESAVLLLTHAVLHAVFQ